MYYEEKIIDGVLYWRGKPNGNWIKKTQAVDVTDRIEIKPSGPKPTICTSTGEECI